MTTLNLFYLNICTVYTRIYNESYVGNKRFQIEPGFMTF